ncbi:MAG TPA: helix-turn-helix domain-containing protein [Candidatus Eisenbacteria bacterium]|jgi:DNA-binding HxlR family transcriptional regulator
MRSVPSRSGRPENPVEVAIAVIGGKWKMPILRRLAARIWRYGELRRDLGGVTHKMLTQQLRELERDGLLRRTVYAEVPPRVEYAITPLGRSALPSIRALGAWGARYRRRATRAVARGPARQSRRRT